MLQRYSRHVFLSLFCVFFLFLSFAITAKPAYADPHAMFYTAIGQRQLFFNVLAALDQADYVETPQEREQTRELRAEAGFSDTNDPALRATETDLANILTRGVTLEGQDLWSTQIAYQFALEVARRRNVADMVKVFCQRGLGIKDCEQGKEDPKTAAARRDHAFVHNPVEEAANATMRGRAVLRAGTADDQERRRAILSSDNLSPHKTLPYNSGVDDLITTTQGSSEKSGMASGLLDTVAFHDTGIGVIDAGVMHSFQINSNGRPTYTGISTIDGITSSVSGIASLPVQAYNARSLAEQQIAMVNQQKTTESGTRADTYPIPSVENNKLGSIVEGIRAPASLKEEQAKEAIAAVSRTESSLQYADSEENIPGGTELIRREGENGGTVSGAMHANNGRVLSSHDGEDEIVTTTTLDEDDDPFPEQTPVSPIPRLSGPTSFTRERSITTFLTQLIGGSQRGGCGCSLSGLLQSFGDDILDD